MRTVMAETAEMRITVARESGLWAFTHLQWELEDVEVRERGEHNLRRRAKVTCELSAHSAGECGVAWARCRQPRTCGVSVLPASVNAAYVISATSSGEIAEAQYMSTVIFALSRS